MIVGVGLVLWALLNIGGIFEQSPLGTRLRALAAAGDGRAAGRKLPAGAWLVPAQAGLAMAVVGVVAFSADVSPRVSGLLVSVPARSSATLRLTRMLRRRSNRAGR